MPSFVLKSSRSATYMTVIAIIAAACGFEPALPGGPDDSSGTVEEALSTPKGIYIVPAGVDAGGQSWTFSIFAGPSAAAISVDGELASAADPVSYTKDRFETTDKLELTGPGKLHILSTVSVGYDAFTVAYQGQQHICFTLVDGTMPVYFGQTKIKVTPPFDLVTGTACAGATPRKFHPGHYISVMANSSDATLVDSLRPGVQGVQIRYRWRELEPVEGQYDFQRLKGDLDLLASQGKTLVALIEDKSFSASSKPNPDYLESYTVAWTNINKKGDTISGYTMKRWEPYVIGRFDALAQAIGSHFDSHPALEGVAIQESAMGIDNAALAAMGYTPELMRDALITILTNLRVALPTSQVFWYMNFIPGYGQGGKVGYSRDIAAAVAPLGVTMGGPDILPEDASLLLRAYPLYAYPKPDGTGGFAGLMNLFCSAQNDSFEHMKAATGQLYTPLEIFQFARDTLHVKYVFWNRKTWQRLPNAYVWTDALPVMANNQTFNATLPPLQ